MVHSIHNGKIWYMYALWTSHHNERYLHGVTSHSSEIFFYPVLAYLKAILLSKFV